MYHLTPQFDIKRLYFGDIYAWVTETQTLVTLVKATWVGVGAYFSHMPFELICPIVQNGNTGISVHWVLHITIYPITEWRPRKDP